VFLGSEVCASGGSVKTTGFGDGRPHMSTGPSIPKLRLRMPPGHAGHCLQCHVLLKYGKVGKSLKLKGWHDKTKSTNSGWCHGAGVREPRRAGVGR
jgi:hypothetical protein